MRQFLFIMAIAIGAFGAYHYAKARDRRSVFSKKNKRFAIGSAIISLGLFALAALGSNVSLKLF